MATLITDECIACGACEDECPNMAISYHEPTDLFVIDPDLCTECVGHDSEQRCAAACPPDVCVPDLNIVETEKQLFEKYRKIWPEEAEFVELDEFNSHYRMAALEA